MFYGIFDFAPISEWLIDMLYRMVHMVLIGVVVAHVYALLPLMGPGQAGSPSVPSPLPPDDDDGNDGAATAMGDGQGGPGQAGRPSKLPPPPPSDNDDEN